MPHVEAVLEIIRLSLEITLQLIKDMPAEQKAKAWEQHQKNLAFWERLGSWLTPEKPS